MSLLYKSEEEETIQLNTDSYHDLALDELIYTITSGEKEQKFLQNVFTNIPVSYETVKYRQEILQDFMEDEELCKGLQTVLEKLLALQRFGSSFHINGLEKASVWDLIDFMQELEVYVDMIEEISSLFKNSHVNSTALKQIAERIDKIVESGGISHIKKDIEELHTDVSITKSVSLGINLTPDLYPSGVKILGFSNLPYKIDYQQYAGQMTHGSNSYDREAIMKCMTREVEKTMSGCVKKMKKVFRQYLDVDGYFLIDLYDELRYYLLMTKFFRDMEKEGYVFCKPDISENADEVSLKNVYNIRLALQKKQEIVKNDFLFSPREHLYVLTGPNRGGKTILTQGIGIAALMAAVGLFVPAQKYTGFIYHKIFTHFPADDNKTVNYGRLGEEAVRICNIVKEADERSLILLNETYATTCASDGVYLAKDLIHVLKYKNASLIFNTHIRELARMTAQMNEWEGESNVVSIIMEIVDNENTFKVLKSEPNTSSYARNIAQKYGITYEQMMEENS